ncbi:MAG: hypothetical protein M2R45_03703 [Verrucomicrobia subdivision 3 bacterium]|nr:hypothetical protein [Limisphaerales bacterium]MCS1414986.1 hypothetical protein [Limisphaerales bacterium]
MPGGSGENHGWSVYEGFELFSTVYRDLKGDTWRRWFRFTGGMGRLSREGSSMAGQAIPLFKGIYICVDSQSKACGVSRRKRASWIRSAK